MRNNYQSLSLFRILLAIYLGVDFLANILPWYGDFFTDQGMLPRAALLQHTGGRWVPSLLLLSDNPLFHCAFCAVYLAALLAFGCGYRTRAATLILLLATISFNGRNYLLLSGAESLVQLFFVWALFLPLARYWSIDAALDRGCPDRPYPKLPLYSIRIQVGMIYILSAFNKIAGQPWLDGAALGMTLRDNAYGGTIAGLWLAEHAAGLLPALTWGTIVFQFLFTPLIYCPWYNGLTRSVALAGAAAMHISFMFLLSIGMFPYLCLIYLLLFIPDDWWNRWLKKRRARLAGISIYYDPDCVFCRKTALLYRSFCLVPASPVLPADANPAALAALKAHNSWVVYSSYGEEILQWRAVAYILRQSPVFWVFGWLTDLPFLRAPCRRLYDWIGGHRRSLGWLTGIFLPYRAEPVPGWFSQTILAGLLAIALTYSLFVLPRPAFKAAWVQQSVKYMPARAPAWLEKVAEWTLVQQRWNLFAPLPTHFELGFVFAGTQADGQAIDLLTRWHPLPYKMANNHYRLHFYSHRVEKYFTRLRPILEKNPDLLTNYLCRKVNKQVVGSAYITNGQVLYFSESIPKREPMSAMPVISKTFTCPPASPQ